MEPRQILSAKDLQSEQRFSTPKSREDSEVQKMREKEFIDFILQDRSLKTLATPNSNLDSKLHSNHAQNALVREEKRGQNPSRIPISKRQGSFVSSPSSVGSRNRRVSKIRERSSSLESGALLQPDI